MHNRGVTLKRALICCSLVLLLPTAALALPQGGAIVVCAVDDVISPVTAEFIIESLAAAQEQDAALFVLRLDTPGGL